MTVFKNIGWTSLTLSGIGNVFMLQYRGYGLSTGTPNEKGINVDAQTGLDYIRNRHELRSTHIVLYGQSLGGAVSIGLAARNQKQGDIAGVILENTFTSMRKMIPSSVLPWEIWLEIARAPLVSSLDVK